MNIVTGMHRSGTSFAGNLLFGIGSDFGDPELLLKKDIWNMRGYYENREIVLFNNRLIHGSLIDDTYWKIMNSKLPVKPKHLLISLLNAPAFLFPSIKRIGRRAGKQSDQLIELADKYADKVIKDVRYSITLGAWREHVPVSKVLFCYRHPFEVAMSLKKRQGIPIPLGLWLWQLHNREFFAQSQQVPMIMVHYNNFLQKEKQDAEMQRLYRFLEKPYKAEEAHGLLGKVLDEKLCHNRAQHQSLPPTLQRQYDQLNEWHEDYAEFQPVSAQL